MSNVEIVAEDEPPDGQPLLGLYPGVPLPRRTSTYSGMLPDKSSTFGGPITRLAAGDEDRLRREVRHVVLHEIAHHFEGPQYERSRVCRDPSARNDRTH
jgi:predicted Zn-dependent protease with MMP-like domain